MAQRTPLDFFRRRPGLIGFLVLLGGIAGGWHVNNVHDEAARQQIVDSAQATAIVSCNRDFEQIKRERANIVDDFAQIDLFVSEGTITPAQGKRAKGELRDELKNTPLPDCREASAELTADPDEDVRIPQAKYPGYQRDKG